jgi:hypothetical protein
MVQNFLLQCIAQKIMPVSAPKLFYSFLGCFFLSSISFVTVMLLLLAGRHHPFVEHSGTNSVG